MKIVLTTESFPPNVSGVAVATLNLANNLTKKGHEVYVFCPGKSFTARKDKNWQDFYVKKMRSFTNPFRNEYRISLVSKREAVAELRKIKPDLIHLQDPAAIGKAFYSAANKLKIPVVITNHFSLEYALSYVRFLGPLTKAARKMLTNYLVNFYNKCDLVLTPTNTVRRQIEKWGVKTKVMAASNGIDFKHFQKDFTAGKLNRFKARYNLPDKPIILYLGRIDKDKSIDVLVQAMPEVLQKIDCHLVIAGNGDELENIKKLTEELNIQNNVTFLGRMDHGSDDFLMVYKAAAVFAIPSTIETQSIVTLEAMSSGLPIVAADANALPELVKPDINGFLFKPGDSGVLSKSLIRVLSSEKIRQSMGKNSEIIASDHDMNKAFNHMLDIYHEVIKNNHNTL